MKELYLAIVVLCFFMAVMVYCVNKSIQSLKYLYNVWKNYKQSQEEILDFLRKENEIK